MHARLAVVLFAAVGLAGIDEGRAPDYRDLEAANPVRPLPTAPLGINRLDDLPNSPSPERVRLGRWLFYDTRLSADGHVSCATCHVPERAFSNGTRVATGVRGPSGIRKTPSVVNAAHGFRPNRFGWDGRASSLEEQSLGPIMNPGEMGNTASGLVRTLTRIPGYARYFEQAFGDREVTLPRVASALADYQRTRMSGNSAWDRWQAGDPRALSPSARRGWNVFTGDAKCSWCHVGPNFTDGGFHNLGVGWDAVSQRYADDGRAAVTGQSGDRGAFKTPTLRDVARHPPYMHDGSLRTLREVIEFYVRGGIHNPHLDTQVRPLQLQPGDIDALISFLESLNGEGFVDRAPAAFPR
jgi:cytochrome c peroxidase